MSEQNVAAVREAFAAFNTGEIERIVACTHPAFEAEVPAELSAEPDTYHGHDGIRRYFHSFEDAMEDVRFQPERFWEAGESVVVTVRLTAKGRQTAIPVEQQIAQVWMLREGKALRISTYATLEEALQAAGLAG